MRISCNVVDLDALFIAMLTNVHFACLTSLNKILQLTVGGRDRNLMFDVPDHFKQALMMSNRYVACRSGFAMQDLPVLHVCD